MYDPYAPIRTELGRLSQTVGSGMSKRAESDLRREQMRLGHAQNMLGYGMQQRRLDMAEKTHGQTSALNAIQLQRAQKEEKYRNELVEVGADMPGFTRTFGANAAQGFMQGAPDDAQVNQDGKGKFKIPRWQLQKNLDMMGKKFQGAQKVQDKTGQWVFMFPDGRKVETSVYSHMEKKDTFEQRKELAGIKASTSGGLTLSQKRKELKDKFTFLNKWEKEYEENNYPPDKDASREEKARYKSKFELDKNAQSIEYDIAMDGEEVARKKHRNTPVKSMQNKAGDKASYNFWGKRIGQTDKAGVHRFKIGQG